MTEWFLVIGLGELLCLTVSTRNNIRWDCLPQRPSQATGVYLPDTELSNKNAYSPSPSRMRPYYQYLPNIRHGDRLTLFWSRHSSNPSIPGSSQLPICQPFSSIFSRERVRKGHTQKAQPKKGNFTISFFTKYLHLPNIPFRVARA